MRPANGREGWHVAVRSERTGRGVILDGLNRGPGNDPRPGHYLRPRRTCRALSSRPGVEPLPGDSHERHHVGWEPPGRSVGTSSASPSARVGSPTLPGAASCQAHGYFQTAQATEAHHDRSLAPHCLSHAPHEFSQHPAPRTLYSGGSNPNVGLRSLRVGRPGRIGTVPNWATRVPAVATPGPRRTPPGPTCTTA